MTTTQKPTVGRIVHYQPLETHPEWQPDTEGRTGQPWAAIITEVIDDDTVKLHILNPIGTSSDPIERDPKWSRADSLTPGHWTWPTR